MLPEWATYGGGMHRQPSTGGLMSLKTKKEYHEEADMTRIAYTLEQNGLTINQKITCRNTEA